ncbi:hypothetical protein RYD26_02775 [Pasteurellaceae bacterium LIM206]|nr:hypothetical protein [Pasteurellaceae bacterium LIM206]
MTFQVNDMDIEQLNQQLAELAKQTRRAIDSNDFSLAKQTILNVLKMVPNHDIALADLAFVESKLGNKEAAMTAAEQALQYSRKPIDPYIYDTLVSRANDLNRREEAFYYAKLAIKTKLEQVKDKPYYPLPARAAPGLSTDPAQNIISYSVFGAQPRYCEVAVLNAKLAKLIYPQWTCRFYVDQSVPENVVERLRLNNAEVVYVNEEQQKISGLFWRFFVMDDPRVRCFMVRDADSLLSFKEQAAVNEWLASGKYFHVMRDGVGESELILAGMWGGYTGVFPNMQQIIRRHYAQIQVFNKTIDQYFLRELWPTISRSLCLHESVQLQKGSLPFPDYELSDIEKIPYFHIGMVDAHLLHTRIDVEDPSAERIHWFLQDEHNNTVCHYIAAVPESRVVTLYLPYFYSKRIQRQEWTIKYHKAE